MRREKQRKFGVMLYSLCFFLRRFAICLTLIFWDWFFWGQVVVQFFSATLTIAIISVAEPLASRKTARVEIFNEVVTMGVLYLLMLFSEYVDDPNKRYLIGYAFLALLGFYTVVHISIVLADLISKLKHSLKMIPP